MTELTSPLPLIESSRFRIGDWLVDPVERRISRGDEAVKIDPRNMRVLLLLASRANELVTQAEIEQTVWSGLVVTPNSVYQSIAQLRRALRFDGDTTRYIETVSRKGYRLIAPLSMCQRVVGASTSLHETTPDRIDDAEPAREQSAVHPRSRFRAGQGIAAVCFVVALSVWIIKTIAPSAAPSEKPLSAEASELLRGDATYRKAIESNSALSERLAAATSPDDMSIAAPLTSVANLQLLTSNPVASEATSRRVLAVLDLHGQRRSEEAIEPLKLRARALIDLGRYRDAEQTLQEALNLAMDIHGPLHDAVAWTHNDIARLLIAQGRYADAEITARKALGLYLANPHALSTRALQLRHTLILALNGQQKFELGIAEGEQAIQSIRPDEPAAPYLVAMGYHGLGEALLGASRFEDAAAALNKAIELYESIPHRVADKAGAQSGLAAALLELGYPEEALTILQTANRTMSLVGDGWRERSIRSSVAQNLKRLRLDEVDRKNRATSASLLFRQKPFDSIK